MNRIRLISKTIAATNKWTTIVDEKFEFSDGRQGEYLIVERMKALAILPLIETNGEYYTYMVRQYRYPIDREVWQFPMGTLETGKDIVAHAKDELHEETGLIAHKLTLIHELFVDPGLSRQVCSVYIAEDIVEGGAQKLEESEKGLIAKKIALADLDEMIDKRLVCDLWAYSSIRLLQDYVAERKG